MHVLSPLPFLTLLGTTLAFRASPPHQRADVPTANITILVPSTGAHPTFLLKTDGSYVSMTRARPGTILLEKEEGVNVRCEIDLVDGRTETLGPDVLSVEVVPETNTKGGSCVLV